jgi:hypothetical protein
MIVFLLSGLWHGSSWNFVVWGLLNGLGVVFDSVNPRPIKNKTVARLCTFGYFLFTLIFFRSETLSDAVIILQGLINPKGIRLIYDVAQHMDIPELYFLKKGFNLVLPQYTGMVYLLAFLVLMAVCILLLLGKNPEEIVKEGKYKTTTALGLAVIFIWSVISLSGVSTFLYFNF